MHADRPVLPTTLAALGVVYGDIGTSPLYALETAVGASGSAPGEAFGILGVLSLIFWSLFTLVTVQYVVLLLRADNQGEGGILSLFALLQRRSVELGDRMRWIAVLAIAGAALFYCDALITPAISVLSAVEGLEVLDPQLERIVIPTTVVILVLLFAIQRRGTEKVGRIFGPVMIVWFVTLAVSGAFAIAAEPRVLLALDPLRGFELLAARPGLALAIVGAVFLAVTGGEALYADMGHFGKVPVRLAWFGLVWPSLLLAYFGQGAEMLRRGENLTHAVYALVPQSMVGPMVILATAATVIASQAVISGAYSVTRQAVQLDMLPRLQILQTSASEAGQIYVPVVNYFMLAAVLVFVFTFQSSGALSAAYGAAVAGTMVITTILARLIARFDWKWPLWRTTLVFGVLSIICVGFLCGNLTKFADGAWVPLLLAVMMSTMFMIWRDGRLRLRAALVDEAVPIGEIDKLTSGATRVAGTAVFLASNADYVPSAMLRNLEHNRVLHERNIILHIEFARMPRWDPADRVRVETIGPELYYVTARYGFMETPDVSDALRRCRARGIRVFTEDNTFFLGWHLVKPRPRSGWTGVRNRLFAWMQRRSTQAAEFFRMPSRRVVVLATDIEV